MHVAQGTLVLNSVAISDTRAVRSGRVAGDGPRWIRGDVRRVVAAAQCT